MSHLDTAYRLGQEKAAEDLGAWIASGIDNPTAPPASGYTKTAIDRMIQKLATKPRSKKKQMLRNSPSKGTRYSAMVRKLKKKKKKGR